MVNFKNNYRLAGTPAYPQRHENNSQQLDNLYFLRPQQIMLATEVFLSKFGQFQKRRIARGMSFPHDFGGNLDDVTTGSQLEAYGLKVEEVILECFEVRAPSGEIS